MEILLHTCCAPCLIYPWQRLKEKGFNARGLFYNPNIHPFAEYKNRRQAAADYAKSANIELIYPEYKPEEFFRAVNLKEAEPPERCFLCWSLRLNKTAEAARENGMSHFSTTLLASPYQDQEALIKIGSDIAQEKGVEFYYEDFRPGFRKAHNEAKAQGLYCQRYCGCIYSEIERANKKQ